MNFSEALKLMKMGSKVSREAWRGTISFICIDNGEVWIRLPDGKNRLKSTFKSNDILAEDWWLVT